MDARSNQPNPTRIIPTTQPETVPQRRLEPAKICPAQRGRVAERVRRELTQP
jgi:hypothetical protein